MAEGAPTAFVSYSRKDSRFALRLARDLKAAGVTVWLDQLSVIPGQEWDRAIGDAVKNCRCMLVILSPDSAASIEVANEFHFALDQQKIVIPVLHRDCDVPFRLLRRQRADFREEYARGFQELLRAFASSEDHQLSGPEISDVGGDSSSNIVRAVVRQAARVQGGRQARAPMLLVTFRFESEGANVWAYDEDGNCVTSAVLIKSRGVPLGILRGLCRVGRCLYVVNAKKSEQSVLCYEGSGTQYTYVSRFASHQTTSTGILGPFDLSFDDIGYCYLSNIRTNVITRLIVSRDGRIGGPAPIAAALPPEGWFLPGTFVPSSYGYLSEPPTTRIAAPAGLAYSSFTDAIRSVRGLAWAKGRLYVADQHACSVKIYDITGKYLGQSNELDSPTHVVVHSGRLYVSCGEDHVFTSRLPVSPGKFVLRPLKTVRVKSPSGMAFGGSSEFYVASRTEKRILKFDRDFKPMKFRCDVPHIPEFLLHV